MLLRLPKDAYPLAPSLRTNTKTAHMKTKAEELLEQEVPVDNSLVNSNVQIFPINR